MRFLPHTPDDIAHMLAVIGADSVDALFPSVPQRLRDRASIDLAEGLGEREVVAAMEALAGANRPDPGFQGAGCYHHYVPAVVGQIMGRAEFATAYTPYQPEVSQGTLQATFEFQTYVTMLTGLEVANASLYDGASAFAEALLMALRIGRKRSRILVSAGVHPQYIEVARTYLDGFGRGEIVEVPLDETGRTDAAALESLLGDDVVAVCTGYPNVFGIIDDLSTASRLARRVGALSISVTPESLALALLRSPGSCGVDIAVAEGQSLGLPLAYGGPGLGLFATRREHVRQMPGRVVGETVDEHGRRGYVLTLSTREQHIRREKATSNICTNQGLAALCVTVFLSLCGRNGLRALAVENARRAHDAAQRLQQEAGVQPIYSGPFFNEFAVRLDNADERFDAAVASGLIPGVPLRKLFPHDAIANDGLLIAVTETADDAAIDALVGRLSVRAAA